MTSCEINCQRIECGRKAIVKVRCGFHWFYCCGLHAQGNEAYYDYKNYGDTHKK